MRSTSELVTHITERQKYELQHGAAEIKQQHRAAKIRVASWSGRNNGAASKSGRNNRGASQSGRNRKSLAPLSPSYSLADGSHKADNYSQANDHCSEQIHIVDFHVCK